MSLNNLLNICIIWENKNKKLIRISGRLSELVQISMSWNLSTQQPKPSMAESKENPNPTQHPIVQIEFVSAYW